jgi:hypothetical protein
MTASGRWLGRASRRHSAGVGPGTVTAQAAPAHRSAATAGLLVQERDHDASMCSRAVQYSQDSPSESCTQTLSCCVAALGARPGVGGQAFGGQPVWAWTGRDRQLPNGQSKWALLNASARRHSQQDSWHGTEIDVRFHYYDEPQAPW